MMFLLTQYWIWLAAALAVGVATPLLSDRFGWAADLADHWLVRIGAVLALLLGLLLTGAIAGKPALLLETATAAVLAYVAGGVIGGGVNRLMPARFEGWFVGLFATAIVWAVFAISTYPKIEPELRSRVAAAVESAGSNPLDFDLAGRDVLLPADLDKRDDFAASALAVPGVRRVTEVEALTGAALAARTVAKLTAEAEAAKAEAVAKAEAAARETALKAEAAAKAELTAKADAARSKAAVKAAEAAARAEALAKAEAEARKAEAVAKLEAEAKEIALKAEAAAKAELTAKADAARAKAAEKAAESAARAKELATAEAAANEDAAARQAAAAKAELAAKDDSAHPSEPPAHQHAAQPAPAPTIPVQVATADAGVPVVDAKSCQSKLSAVVLQEKINFEPKSAELSKASLPVLAKLGGLIAQCSNLQIEVAGHTDGNGKTAANQALSQRRAEAVVATLTKLGVGSAKLAARGYGSTQPIANNATPDGRSNNRRIEFVVK